VTTYLFTHNMNCVFPSSLCFLFFILLFSLSLLFLFLLPTTRDSIFLFLYAFIPTVIWIGNYLTLLCFSAHSTSNYITVSMSACACAWLFSDNRNEKRKQPQEKNGWIQRKIAYINFIITIYIYAFNVIIYVGKKSKKTVFFSALVSFFIVLLTEDRLKQDTSM